jgi:hypothetical protein
VPDRPLAAYRRVSSGERPIPHVRSPVGKERTTASVRGSISATRFDRPMATKTRLSSRVARISIACTGSGMLKLLVRSMVRTMRCVAASKMLIVPRCSDETQTVRPPFRNSTNRGRLPTGMLSRSLPLRASMKCARFATSEVATTRLPSGLTPTPSGSGPTETSWVILPDFRSRKETALWSSLAM